MHDMRLLGKPEDFKKPGINQDAVEPWEDERRNDEGAGKNEVWYFDALLDDGSRLIIGFRPKRPSSMNRAGDAPDFNIAITTPEGKTLQEFADFDASDWRRWCQRCPQTESMCEP
jgi:hypothetical protein